MDMAHRQYKIVELTRHKNRREQRKLEHDLNSKRGLQANHTRELLSMNREQKKIEKELRQIRYDPDGNLVQSRPRHTLQIESLTPRATLPVTDSYDITSSPRTRKKDTKKYIFQIKDETDYRRTKEQLRQFYFQSLENNSPEPLEYDNNLNKPNDSFIVSPSPNIITPKLETHLDKLDEKLPINGHQEALPSPRGLKRPSRPEPGIGDINVSNAKDNIHRRLVPISNESTPPNSNKPLSINTNRINVHPLPTRTLPPAPDLAQRDFNIVKPKLSPVEEDAPKVNAPAVKPSTDKENKASKKGRKQSNAGTDTTMEFDAEKYNPDGSLRTLYTMPSSTGRFEQARKARYVRHREKPDFETELTVGQIFESITKRKMDT